MKGIDWKNINWKNVNRHVRRLQNSIAKSSEHGDHEKVKKLQAILWNSRSAKLLGIRKVTQDNQGCKTAGVDGKAKLSPKERIELVSEINVYGKWARVKQVEIPKPNGSTRTLGIPTMKDRARQAVMKFGLEPSYESNAEPNSYGFRPARSTQDAIDAIFNSLTGKSKEVKGKYIVEGDLKGFFDNIKPEAIIDNTLVKHDIELKKSLKNLIKSGGINPKGMVIETDKGTPQGGVISPLLANIAFTGLESFINEWAWDNRKLLGIKRKDNLKIQTIVYADDFVILAKEKWIAELLLPKIMKWCKEKMGVELNLNKTHITSSLDGFDFLGFNCRHYQVGSKLKTIIKPSNQSIKNVKEKIRVLIKTHKGVSQETLIEKLNPVLRGWGNHFKHVVSKEIFNSIDAYVYERLTNWTYKKHVNKGKTWIRKKYFHSDGSCNWVFRSGKQRLVSLREIKIQRHVKIKGNHHVYDGDINYWRFRNKKTHISDKSSIFSKIYVKQNGCCKICKEQFGHDDNIELDHIIPKSLNGENKLSNYQLLHNHCHDTKTAMDGSLRRHRKDVCKV